MYLPNRILLRRNRCTNSFHVAAIVFLTVLLSAFSTVQLFAQQQAEIDVVFVVDESSSMGSEHMTLQQNIQTVINGLQAANLDWRFGLVSFGDNTNSGAPVILSPLVNNTNALSSLQVGGGIEPGFDATMIAVSNAMNFRSTAGKCVILISDEDADPPTNPQHQQLQQQAIAALQGRSAVFFGIVEATAGTTQADYGPNPGSLAAATNGQVFSIVNFVSNPTIVLETLTTSCVSIAVPGKICGMKFNDLNGNGIKDNGEPGLPNWEIVAQDQQNNSLTEVTGVGGKYCLSVPPGTYTVSEIQQSPWVQTYPTQPGTHTITVQSGQTVNNVHFGNRLPNGSIRGLKFWDVNGNGVRDQLAGSTVLEPLMDNFQFNLFSGDPNTPSTWSLVAGPLTITNANLGYQFSNIPPGNYFVREIPKPGWSQTYPQQNGPQIVTLSAGQHATGLNFGNQPCQNPCDSYIMGFKFNDRNHNGQWGSNENGLGGVTIELLDANGTVIQTTTTNANGLYYFLNVQPGTYTVREQPLSGWVQTAPTTGGGTHTVTITQGNNAVGLNFGNYRCRSVIVAYPPSELSKRSEIPIDFYRRESCITGVKFNDLDGDGVQDAQEPPLAGFVFMLQATNGSASYIVTSDTFGNFSFIVPPGNYYLYEIGLPGGWTPSPGSPSFYQVSVGAGMQVSGFDFGNWRCNDRTKSGLCRCERGKLDMAVKAEVSERLVIGEKAEYIFHITNVGDCATEDATTLNIQLPAGITPVEREWAMEGWRCQVDNGFVQCTQQKPLEQGGYSSLQLPMIVGPDIDAEIQSCAAVITKGDSNVENNLLCVTSKVEGKRDEGKSLITPTQQLQAAADTPADGPPTLIYIPLVRD